MTHHIIGRTVAIFVPVALASLMACSSGPGYVEPREKLPHITKSGTALTSQYSIKFYAKTATSTTLVNVVPTEIASAAITQAKQNGKTPAKNSMGIHTLDITVPTTDPTAPLVVTGPDDLLHAAAAQCGLIGDVSDALIFGANSAQFMADPAFSDIVTEETNAQRIPSMFYVAPPWNTESEAQNPNQEATPPPYYIFSTAPTSCDAVLEDEEALVCIADQLAQLADTVGPLTWHAAQFLLDGDPNTPPADQTFPVSWIIPPQAEADKFIVRDLAIDVLAHIPMFDSYTWMATDEFAQHGVSSGATCSALYAQDLTNPSTDLENTLYENEGRPTQDYPPNPPANSQRNQVMERQAFEAGVLRTAGQLLHDLVRESVYSDLAGAAAQAASAADQAGGQLLAWGLAGNSQYNSLAHVARTLMGRWDVAIPDPNALAQPIGQDPETDPQCHGITELNLLPGAADPAMRARAGDLGAVTSTQALAETLFEEAGLVFADDAPTDGMASALTTQLASVKAARLGFTTPATIPADITQAISNLVATLSTADLTRAAQHNRVTFSILTNQPTAVIFGADATIVLGPIAQNAGLTVSTIANSALGTNGIAIDGGLLRANATTDPMAHSGPMMVASQCPEASNGISAIEQSEGIDLAPLPVNMCTDSFGNWTSCGPPFQQFVGPFPGASMRQDVFAIGNAIRGRLVKLREAADKSAAITALSTPDAQARAAAVAEIGAWAGGTRAVIQTNTSGFTLTPPTQLTLLLLGAVPSDFGVNDPSLISGQVSLVYGDAHLAECAAHLTNVNCDPTNTVIPAATWLPAAGGNLGLDAHGLASNLGVTDNFIALGFTVSGNPGAPAQLAASIGTDSANGFENPFYLVLKQDPSKPSGVGEVLGALQFPIQFRADSAVNYGEASLTLSPMRRELITDAFGLGKWVGAVPPQAGELSSAASPGFCVEGVPRDIFVPLQNDLTDSNDSYENSWQHYLTLAQAAATNADTLAEQMVDIGFQETQTVESAGEGLLATTGANTNLADLTIDANGAIDPGPSNGALASVLNPPTLDVVMFASDPSGLTGTTSPSVLATSLGCPAPNSGQTPSQICTRLAANPPVQKVQLSNVGGWAGRAAGDTTTVYYSDLGPVPPPPRAKPQCQPVVNSALALKGVSIGANGPAYSGTTNFSANALSTAAHALDLTKIQGALQNTRMTIDDSGGAQPGHWQLAFSGTPIMDSDDPGSWPGCLRGATCDFTNPVVAAFNDMFRWDSNLRGDALGGNEGAGSPIPDAEINEIRWRVEGALWLAGAMSGNIPQGMFSGPMPIANFPFPNNNYSAPVPTYIGSGSLSTGGGNVTFSGSYGPADIGESTALSQANPTAVDPASRYFKWGSTGSQQVPEWLLTIYAPTLAGQRGTVPFQTGDSPQSSGGPPYVHIFGSNLSGTTSLNGVAGLLSGSPVNLSGLGSSFNPQMWGKLGALMDGHQCQSPTTAGQFIHAADGWLQGVVASVKTLQTPDSDMMKTFAGLQNGTFEYATFYAMEQEFSNSSAVPVSIGPLNSPPGPQALFDQVPVRMVTCNNCGASGGDNHGYSGTDFLPPGFSSSNQRDLSVITPDQRLRFALNSGAPNGNCDAAWQLTQAMAMSCLLAYDVTGVPWKAATEPPTITTVEQLDALSAWLESIVTQDNSILQAAYITAIPAAVIANASGVSGALTSTSGQVGKDLAQTANALISVFDDWTNIETEARSIADDVQMAQAQIDVANVTAERQAINDYITKLQGLNAIAKDVAAIVGGVGQAFSGGTPWQIFGSILQGASTSAAGIATLVNDEAVLGQIQKLQLTDNEALADNINVAIATLNGEVNSATGALTIAMGTLHQDINNIGAGTAGLATDKATASYYAGKATGADVWQCGSSPQPVECVSHVNTVLNRRYDGTQIRYNSALQNAKALAYTARLSIEQRLGIRLNDITTPIGTLAAPSTWADDVCHLTGVNYKELEGELPEAGALDQQSAFDQQIAGQFADQFIGDYVQKLSDFVTFYNTTYPEQDGNDTAVLSLRETLLGGNSACQAPATNLIADSSRIYETVFPAANQSLMGWTLNTCATADANCLQVKALASSEPPTLPGGASWLSDQARPPEQNGVDIANADTVAGGPDDVVSQQVVISVPGTYILSWWDEAIDPTTAQPATAQSTAPVPYQVGIYDSSWSPVGGYSAPPSAAGWGPRNTIVFTAATPDVFHVVFGASVPGGAPGNVAIANVQLELASSSGTPTAYVDTDVSGQMTSYACALTPAQFQAAFTHNCDPDGTCHYDLNIPIAINTQTMTSNGVSIAGKLATGNFNFRHIDVAANVVGTGVLDCSSSASPDCFASGFVQYTLTDDGTNVGVLGFDKQYRTFDFGKATIDHGKALSAERYLTTPLASADQSLVTQVEQPQFRGRPIDGVYRLSIYDSPALHFDQVQDVQLVLNYHYWSRVITANNAN